MRQEIRQKETIQKWGNTSVAHLDRIQSLTPSKITKAQIIQSFVDKGDKAIAEAIQQEEQALIQASERAVLDTLNSSILPSNFWLEFPILPAQRLTLSLSMLPEQLSCRVSS